MKKPKILIFSSTGGNGHESAAKALEAYLGSDYTLIKVFPIQELWLPSFIAGERFYNFLLMKKLYKVLNLFVRFFKYGFALIRKTRLKKTNRYLDEIDADLFISLVPYINNTIIEQAKKRNRPFMIITCDLDTKSYLFKLKPTGSTLFRYLLPFDDRMIRQVVDFFHFAPKQLVYAGFPLRPNFFVEHNAEKIIRDFNFPIDKPIVLLMMGGTGSRAVYEYAKRILTMDIPLHLIACCGREESLCSKIQTLPRNQNNSLTCLGFTDRVSELMQISQVLVTKPGPTSIAEALYKQVPVILDNSAGTIFWEKFNLGFVKKHGFGDIANRYDHIQPLLKKFLTDTRYYSQCKAALRAYPKPDFRELIKQEIAKLLQA